MKISQFELKKLFIPIDSFRKIILFTILLIIPWSLLTEIIKYKQLLFYDSYDLRVFFSNFIFAVISIIYLRSIALFTIGFYAFVILPFVTYLFLRKGVLFGDLKDLDELMYALGNFSSYVIYIVIIIFLALIIFVNIRFFKIKIFLIQIIFAIFIYFSFIFPIAYEKFFYPIKPNVEDFNVSAAFRNIGPVDAFFYNYLNTLSFEKKLKANKKIFKYEDFRSFNLDKNISKKNIHIILLESFIDPTDFTNVKIKENAIPNEWIKFKNKNKLYGISPVSGGGSAQAEFELLCGAPSIIEYGTEFNRMANGHTSCLPNYLKKFGYKTIASQPMYGSFFNIKKAYQSIGFDEIYLLDNFDKSDMRNGWLSDKSFFTQHIKYLKKSLLNNKPILNYIFAVGCHSTLGQSQSNKPLIEYSNSSALENSLRCNTETIQYLTEYINQIQDLDPKSLIFILSDHYPPGISKYKEAGYNCLTYDKTLSCPNMSKMRAIFIGDNFKMDYKNSVFAYYELPEIIINNISNNTLCNFVRCSIDKNLISYSGSIVDRKSFVKVSEQSLYSYQIELYQSLLRESLLNIDD